jgi:hypothetical protein
MLKGLILILLLRIGKNLSFVLTGAFDCCIDYFWFVIWHQQSLTLTKVEWLCSPPLFECVMCCLLDKVTCQLECYTISVRWCQLAHWCFLLLHRSCSLHCYWCQCQCKRSNHGYHSCLEHNIATIRKFLHLCMQISYTSPNH